MSDIETPQFAEDNKDDEHRDLDELGEKLRQVQESRETKERVDGPSHALPQSGLGMGLRIATELVVGVMIGLGIGWYIDRWLGTEPWGLLVFFVLGFTAGILNVIRAANKMGDMDGSAGDEPPPSQD